MAYDVLVIGGGPAGATAALLLARAGWSVAVIEKARYPRRKVCGEFLSATNAPLLRELGIAELFLEMAGPEIQEVGLFAGDALLKAPMPRPAPSAQPWGRALVRESLDALLLERARQTGATVMQPWRATALRREGGHTSCVAENMATADSVELRAPIVIAAHGSWESAPLPTQPAHRSSRPTDLLGFKAHFLRSYLPANLMPLLMFPGGYGGMVHVAADRISLSCCICKDMLDHLRKRAPQVKAADVVLDHLLASCLGARLALRGAARDGPWLAAGPIRPGIRTLARAGLFAVGNAAGEAHPVIAEGISMAMQSAWLLCDILTGHAPNRLTGPVMANMEQTYARRWRQAFALRIRLSALLAQVAMRPQLHRLILPMVRLLPGLLTLGARWSGKTALLVETPFFQQEHKDGHPAIHSATHGKEV